VRIFLLAAAGTLLRLRLMRNGEKKTVTVFG